MKHRCLKFRYSNNSGLKANKIKRKTVNRYLGTDHSFFEGERGAGGGEQFSGARKVFLTFRLCMILLGGQ